MLTQPEFVASRETKIIIEMMLERSKDADPVITWMEAEKATGRPREKLYSPIQTAINRMLNQYGQVWICDRGVGYRLAKDGDIAREMESDRKKGHRIARKALKKSDCADVTKMNATEQVQFIMNKTVMEMHKSISSPRAMTCVEQMAVRKHNEWTMDELLDSIRQSLRR